MQCRKACEGVWGNRRGFPRPARVVPGGCRGLKEYLPLEGQEIMRMRREETEETSD